MSISCGDHGIASSVYHPNPKIKSLIVPNFSLAPLIGNSLINKKNSQTPKTPFHPLITKDGTLITSKGEPECFCYQLWICNRSVAFFYCLCSYSMSKHLDICTSTTSTYKRLSSNILSSHLWHKYFVFHWISQDNALDIFTTSSKALCEKFLCYYTEFLLYSFYFNIHTFWCWLYCSWYCRVRLN